MKEGKISGRKIIYVILALLLIGICLLAYERVTDIPKKKVDMLFLGDSLIGQYRDETSVPYLVGEYLELETYNGAFGGSCLSRLNYENNKAYQRDGLSLVSLAQAIAYDDFRIPQTVRVRAAVTEHFPQVVDELEEIDYSSLRFLLVEYGTNDYFAGVPLDNPENPYDEYTLAGALRSSLEILRKHLPDLQIILISPTYNWYIRTGGDCENMDFGGGYLKDYVDTISNVALEYGVGYVDLYKDFYPTGDNSYAGIYTTDGIHPNEAGRIKIAQAIEEYMKNWAVTYMVRQ